MRELSGNIGLKPMELRQLRASSGGSIAEQPAGAAAEPVDNGAGGPKFQPSATGPAGASGPGPPVSTAADALTGPAIACSRRNTRPYTEKRSGSAGECAGRSPYPPDPGTTFGRPERRLLLRIERVSQIVLGEIGNFRLIAEHDEIGLDRDILIDLAAPSGKCPFSMSQVETSGIRASASDRSESRTLLCDPRMSGSVTISISGCPSGSDPRTCTGGIAKTVVKLLPASSSICTRVTPMRFIAPSTAISTSRVGQRFLVLRDLVALRQIRIKIILARESGATGFTRQLSAAAACIASSTAVRFKTGSAPGKPRHTGHTLRIRLRPETGGASAENLGRGRQLDMHLQTDHRLILSDRLWTGQIQVNRRHDPSL